MGTKVKVTAKDISYGMACNANNCPVALACLRTFKAKEVICGTTYITIDSVKYYLPAQVSKIIRGFDNGNKMDPFEFELIR